MFLVMPPCIEDCTKVLIASAHPYVYEEIVKKETVVDKDLEVNTCIEYEGNECKPLDEHSGFYSIITVEKQKGETYD